MLRPFGRGLVLSDWFGHFKIHDDDWIYHKQHGWMFLSWGDGQD